MEQNEEISRTITDSSLTSNKLVHQGSFMSNYPYPPVPVSISKAALPTAYPKLRPIAVYMRRYHRDKIRIKQGLF
jgi:hypothetical protein